MLLYSVPVTVNLHHILPLRSSCYFHTLSELSYMVLQSPPSEWGHLKHFAQSIKHFYIPLTAVPLNKFTSHRFP